PPGDTRPNLPAGVSAPPFSTSLSGYCAAKAAGSCARAEVAEIIDSKAAAASGFNPDMVILHFLFCVSARSARALANFSAQEKIGVAVRKMRRMPINIPRTQRIGQVSRSSSPRRCWRRQSIISIACAVSGTRDREERHRRRCNLERTWRRSHRGKIGKTVSIELENRSVQLHDGTLKMIRRQRVALTGQGQSQDRG